jgi:hypothetical protein
MIYENFTAGTWGWLFTERLAGALDCGLQGQIWSFGVLGLREIRRRSSSAARSADILVVSVSTNRELPGAVRVWLEMVLLPLKKRDPALVGLFASDPKRKPAWTNTYLSDFAANCGIDYFPHEMQNGFSKIDCGRGSETIRKLQIIASRGR